MDTDWCICGRHIDADSNSPYCSQRCCDADASNLVLDPFAANTYDDPYYGPDAAQILERSPSQHDLPRASSVSLRQHHKKWFGRTEEGIRAWAENIPADAYEADVLGELEFEGHSPRNSPSRSGSASTSTSASSSASLRLRRPVFSVSLQRPAPPKLWVPTTARADSMKHITSPPRAIPAKGPTSESSLTSLLTESIATPTSDKLFKVVSNVYSWVAPPACTPALPSQNPLRPSPNTESALDVTYEVELGGDDVKFEGADAPYLMMRSRARRASFQIGDEPARSSLRPSHLVVAGKDRPVGTTHGLPRGANQCAYRTRGRKLARAVS